MEPGLNLSDFFRKDENVLFAIVFSSYVKGRQHKQSDIDIGIYFKGHLEEFAMLEYINKLSDLTGREVDQQCLCPFKTSGHEIPGIKIEKSVYASERAISDYDEYKYIPGMNVYVG